MDQSIHDVRRSNWLNIVNECQQMPANMTVKQWLADNGIKEKSYYYWLQKSPQRSVWANADAASRLIFRNHVY